MLKFEYEKIEAVKIMVTLPSDLDEYAKNFLVLFNTKKEHEKDFLRLENDYGNDVFVTVTKDTEKDAKNFLRYYGEVKSVEAVNVFRVYPVYDKAGFRELYEERNGEEIESFGYVDLEY